MDFKSGVTHDIVLIGSKNSQGPKDELQTGLMLAKDDNDKKMWRVAEASTFSPRISTTSAEYTQFPPEQEMVVAWDNWRDGFGQYKHSNPDAYFEAHGVDTRYSNQLILGPLLYSTAQNGGAALGRATRWNAFAEAFDKLYLFANDGTDSDIWEWDATNGYWVSQETFSASTNSDGLCAFATWLVAAVGGSVYYSTDGAAYTEKASTDVRKGMAVVKANLWGVDALSARSCTDPSGAWGTADKIGEAQADCTGLLCLNDILYVGKEDGLYSWDDTTQIALLPEYARLKNDYNFGAMIGWYNRGYFATGEDGLLCYDPANPESTIDISPSLYAAQITDIGVRVASLQRDDNWLYAVLAPSAQGEYLYVLAGRWQSSGGSTIFAWHPILEFDTSNTADVSFEASWLTTVQGGNPRLWLAESGTTKHKPGYIILSKGHQNPKDDTNYKFTTTGHLITSWVDYGFVDIDKAWLYFTIEADNLTSDRYVEISFRVDDETTWTYLGQVTASGKTTLSFADLSVDLDFVSGRKIQFKVALTTDDADETPIIKSFAMHSVLRAQVKRLFTFGVRCADNLLLLNGSTDRQRGSQIATNLNIYRQSTWPIELYDVDGNKWDVCLLTKEESFVTKPEGQEAERIFYITAIEQVLGFKTPASIGGGYNPLLWQE
uniref:Uncharacterized protein n=1 Tax=viral metagenome TaxID=1070528 RepID=A0A6M3IFZ2_9ZZZZ